MQRRLFMTAGAVTAASVALVASTGATRAQQVTWEDIYGPDGRYRLKMPKGYRYLHLHANSGTLHSYVYMLPDKVVLELMDAVPETLPHIPTGAVLTTALEQMQGGMMKSWPGSTLRDQRQIVTGPFTGRDFTVAAAGDRFVRARIYITRAALYTQVAQGPMSELGSPMIAEFFDSLSFA